MTGPNPGEGGPSLSKDPWAPPGAADAPPPAYPSAFPPPVPTPDPYAPPVASDDPYRFGPPSAPPPLPSYGAGYPPPPPGYGAPGYGGYAPVQQGNGLAVAGLVLGIIALVLCWVPFFMIPVIVLGIIFSALGLSRAGKRGGKGKGMAIAGLVCSIFAVFGQVAVDAWFLHEEGKCADQFPRGTIAYENCMDSIGN